MIVNSYQEEPHHAKPAGPVGYDEDPAEVSISLKNVWRAIKKYFWVLILLAVLGGGGVYAYEKYTYTPSYQSYGVLYISPNQLSETDEGASISLDDKVLNNALYMMQADASLQSVADSLGYSADTVRSRISLSTDTDTDMIEISVSAPSAQEALDLANSYIDSTAGLLQKELAFCNVDVLQAPTLAASPSNSISKKMVIFGAAGGFLIGLLIILIIGLRDHRLYSREEVQDFFGKPVYSELPDSGKGGK